MNDNQINEIQISKEQEKINKINLNRRQRTGSTYGSGFMRTICIVFTIFLALDFFLGFMSFVTTSGDISAVVSSLYWMVIMVLRFLPNICACISLWIIFSKSHNAREIPSFGFKLMMIVVIFQAAVSFITLIIGTLYIIINSNIIIPMEGLDYSFTIILILSIFIIVQLCKILLYVFITISLVGISKDKDGIRPIKLGYISSILCLVFGGFILLNVIPAFNIIQESIISLQLNDSIAYSLIEVFVENPFTQILFGLMIGFGGLIGLLHMKKQKLIDEVINENI